MVIINNQSIILFNNFHIILTLMMGFFEIIQKKMSTRKKIEKEGIKGGEVLSFVLKD